MALSYNVSRNWALNTDEGRHHVNTKGVIQDGLLTCLDASDSASYPGTGTTWYDVSGNNNHFTLDATGITHTTNYNGTFSLSDGGSAIRQSTITTSAAATLVYWIKTTDEQALFLAGDTGVTGSYYVGAYRVGNKEYYGYCGTPTFYKDTADTANIYDYIRDDQWHMLEFKNVNFNTYTWPYFKINDYSAYDFSSTELAYFMIYSRNLTAAESTYNFNALRGRFGI